MKILVTGAAGFIGYHVTQQLLARGEQVLGVDVMNDYYDLRLKNARLEMLQQCDGFEFEQMDLADRVSVLELRERDIGPIIHLAAQAGVRYSIEEPLAYLDANLAAWLQVLELGRAIRTPHLVMASSSSVYGSVETLPFRSNRPVDHPLSLYAATKRSGELLAHSYAHLYGIPTTCLRFFTVYGPWGRPDMALWKFVDAILDGRPIDLYNEGRHRRDFTYVDDIVDGVLKVLDGPARPSDAFDRKSPDPDISDAPFRVYNLGNDVCVDLGRFVRLIEESLGREAICNLLPRQPGDVEASLADIGPMGRDHGWRPQVRVEEGIPRFIEWFEQWRREHPE
jgi:UDP-glucuronate 4-epimerase